jgi:ATP-dependent Lhr-like helicase
VQEQAWAAIAQRDDILVVAPTGSGKTLAAFLWAIDQLTAADEAPSDLVQVLYVSPLKALAVDVERNLRAPLVGIQHEAARLGLPTRQVRIGVRTGDTSPQDRRQMAQHPPQICITTPESLFLLLTSQARSMLAGVHTVIVDEVHAVAGTKRGAHLAVSLERLDALLASPAQRIGLSATVRPLDAVARFLRPQRPATVVAPPTQKQWDLRVQVAVDDMSDLSTSTGDSEVDLTGDASSAPRVTAAERRSSIWPAVDEILADQIQQHHSTLVFANSRRLAERITARINDIAAEQDLPPLARAHHGSVSREQRTAIEEALKSGHLPAVVATSSLELGIDMGAIDCVVQVQAPPSVAAGLQRVGRAGHQVGATSRGIFLPTHRADLQATAVVTERMRTADIEPVRIPVNPLDVLAQQIVAAVAMDDWTVDDLLALLRRSAPFTKLSESVYHAVLDMLSGRYPSEDFAELRPRLVWDRQTNTLTGRPGAQRLAVTSGGTIPDRGLFGVFLAGTAPGTPGARVGELDEEMVYESRVGEVIALGASSWRIEQITHDRVLVSPAPGVPGRVPFWHGDSASRHAELGSAIGAFTREIASSTASSARQRLTASGLDERATNNLLAYLAEQRSSTEALPDDRTIVVERFRDELGDWRVVVHSPFGAAVHGPWALALLARLRQITDVDAQVMHADDGIVLRLPDAEDESVVRAIAECLVVEPEEVEALVAHEVAGTALFASRFREAAARALLLPRRRPGRRSPLWQQRQRSAHLLTVASRYPEFPIVLEAVRECLQDAYDLPALRDLLGRIRGGEVRIVDVATVQPSPFARSLLLGYVATFLYDGDAPLAERKAAALALDPSLLSELLGSVELSELLEPEAIAQVEAELQHLAPVFQARDREDAADLIRLIGPLPLVALLERGILPDWANELVEQRRAILVRIGGVEHVAAIEDAGRLRDGLGVALPPGIPDAYLSGVGDPIGDLAARFARSHGPFSTAEFASATGLPLAAAQAALEPLLTQGRLSRFDAGHPGASRWCDVEVLRRIRRRSIAHLRQMAEPVPPEQYADFLPGWQQVAAFDLQRSTTGARGNQSASPAGPVPTLQGADGAFAVIEQLAGLALPWSVWEGNVLAQRVRDFTPSVLDGLMSSGEVIWWGTGGASPQEATIVMAPADLAPMLWGGQQVQGSASPGGGASGEASPPIDLPTVIETVLPAGAAMFFRDIVELVTANTDFDAAAVSDAAVEAAIWQLLWRGRITNDTLAPLRLRSSARTSSAKTTSPTRLARSSSSFGGGRPARISRSGLRLPTRQGPPGMAGRWSLLGRGSEITETERNATWAAVLLERYGVVTRGAVAAEGLSGGFQAAYRMLHAFEEAGRAQRTYAVAGLGAAQFGTATAIDRLRAPQAGRRGHVLAALDPANAYGAALPWPAAAQDASTRHRPGRRVGAYVALIEGALVGYLERGGATLLTWSRPDHTIVDVLRLLADAHRARLVPRIALTSIDGSSEHDPGSLREAGYIFTPNGWQVSRAGG